MDRNTAAFPLTMRDELDQVLLSLSQAAKDSDDKEMKDMIKTALGTISDTVKILVIGDDRSGKTTFWKTLLLGRTPETAESTQGLEEIRYGEEDCAFKVEEGYVRRFCQQEELKGISVLDTGSRTLLREKRLSVLAKTSDALFVVLTPDNIQCPAVWEFLEQDLEWKKVALILNKTDLLGEDQVREKLDKLRIYMEEAKITAPVFAVSMKGKTGEERELEPVRRFFHTALMELSPKVKRQKEMICSVSGILQEFRQSFDLRYRQFESDYRILDEIDEQMNRFREEHVQIIRRLDGQLKIEIEKRIDEYEQEIVARLNPRTIKERFRSKEDFQDYLELVNQNYQDRLNQEVEHKVQSAIKSYLNELELVYDAASRRLTKREDLLPAQDRFYGSLSKSKREIVSKTRQMAVYTYDGYKTLYEASEELFLKIWKARSRYDKTVNGISVIGAVAGSAAGKVGGAALAQFLTEGVGTALTGLLGDGVMASVFSGVVETGTTAVGTFVGGGVLIPVIALASAVTLGIFAHKMAQAVASPHMEKKVEKCIKEFHQEVLHIKDHILSQVLDETHRLFDRELEWADKSFLEFRMTTNIDAGKLPQINETLKKAERLMDEIMEKQELRGEQRV